MTEAETKTENLFSRLGISQERGQFLGDKCSRIYLEIMNTKGNKKDVVDVLWILREFCQNASEDMFVCYTLGAVHGFFVQQMNRQIAIKNIMENIFGKE